MTDRLNLFLFVLQFNATMALNPAYEAIGKGFVQQYYALFDDPSQRPSLAAMYNVSIEHDILIVILPQLKIISAYDLIMI